MRFLYEQRPEEEHSYSTGAMLAEVRYRVKAVDIWAAGARVRAYALTYLPWRDDILGSILASVQQFGRDAIVDTSGAVTGGTALPAQTFEHLSPRWSDWAYLSAYGNVSLTDLPYRGGTGAKWSEDPTPDYAERAMGGPSPMSIAMAATT